MCQSTLPIEAHQGLFKKYLAQTSAGGGWCLDVDIDEFFDYPLADQVTLNDFLRYLNRKDASAVVTQMLDMFSDRALADLVTETPHDLKSTYRYYDIADVRKCDYRQAELGALFGSDNLPCSARTQLYFGGIRKALYGHECLLTKHSLFVPARVPDLFRHVHFVNGASLADLSCVLYHYKLTPNAADVARQNERHFPGNRQLYADSIVFLNNTLHRRITRDTAQLLGNVNDLVANGFLFASEEYLQGHSRHTN
jgi:hypothetical protein